MGIFLTLLFCLEWNVLEVSTTTQNVKYSTECSAGRMNGICKAYETSDVFIVWYMDTQSWNWLKTNYPNLNSNPKLLHNTDRLYFGYWIGQQGFVRWLWMKNQQVDS